MIETRSRLSTSSVSSELAIEAQHLKKTFKVRGRGGQQIEAVRDVSFNVRRGEIFGFLGPNGAGKSTTISMLITLLTPTSGSAKVAGHDVVRERDAVRRSIGVIFQDQALDLRLTAMDNLELHAILYGVPQEVARKQIEAGLRAVDLWDRRNEPVSRFSGGMKRRLEMARGLIHTPEILFLDEPTIGLDPQARLAMWDYIRRLHSEFGITIFLTTHYMDEAEGCDRIAVIDRGQIIALDTPQNLKSQLGGDVITLRTENDEQARAELQARFGLEAKPGPDGLRLEVRNGEEQLPRLLKELSLRVTRVSLNQPTLEDVFISLTGRALRDEGPDPSNRFFWRGR